MYLLTRPYEDSVLTARALATKNITSHIEPMIVIKHKADALEGYNTAVKDADALIVTSANALEVIKDADKSQFDIPLFTVGIATSNKAKKLGFKHVTCGGEDVNGLCATLKVTFEDKGTKTNLVYASGDVVSYDIASSLEQHQIVVNRVVLYDTRENDALSKVSIELIKSGKIKGVFFFSTRSAEVFVRLVEQQGVTGLLKGVTAFAMSRRVAGRISGLQWSAVRVAERPTQAKLLALV